MPDPSEGFLPSMVMGGGCGSAFLQAAPGVSRQKQREGMLNRA